MQCRFRERKWLHIERLCGCKASRPSNIVDISKWRSISIIIICWCSWTAISSSTRLSNISKWNLISLQYLQLWQRSTLITIEHDTAIKKSFNLGSDQYQSTSIDIEWESLSPQVSTHEQSASRAGLRFCINSQHLTRWTWTYLNDTQHLPLELDRSQYCFLAASLTNSERDGVAIEKWKGRLLSNSNAWPKQPNSVVISHRASGLRFARECCLYEAIESIDGPKDILQ